MLGIICQFLRSDKIYHLHLKYERTLRIWSHLLRKSLTESFIFVHSGKQAFNEAEEVFTLFPRKDNLQNATTSPENQPQQSLNIVDFKSKN